MYKRFSDLAQANLDDYNTHPATHNALSVLLIVGGTMLIGLTAKLANKEIVNPYVTPKF